MKIPISYAEAKQRHPEEVAAAVRALRASTSKHRTEAPSKLEWEYSIAVEARSSTSDILSGAFKSQLEEFNRLSLEQRIEDQLSRSSAVLMTSKGIWRHASPLKVCPPEWERNVRQELTKAQAERVAYEALPDSEKETRKREALASMQGRRNLFAVPKPEKKDP